MSREVIEGRAFTWSRIQRLYESDAITHWQCCESEGQQCSQEVVTQLFRGQANNEDFAVIVRSIDWGRVHRDYRKSLVPRFATSGSIERTSTPSMKRAIRPRALISSTNAKMSSITGGSQIVGRSTDCGVVRFTWRRGTG